MSEKLQRLIQFLCIIYASAWMTVPLTADAPQNDLLLIQTLQKFQRLDGAVALRASKLLRHLWYVCTYVGRRCHCHSSAARLPTRRKPWPSNHDKAKMEPALIGKHKFLKIGQITTTSLSDLVAKGTRHILSVIGRCHCHK